MNINAYRPTEPLIDEAQLSAQVTRRVATRPSPWGNDANRVRPTTLSPSLLADLDRFERKAEGADPLEVLAACIRHARPLVLMLEIGARLLPLRLYPLQGLFVCPADFLDLDEAQLQQLKVVRVQPGQPHQEPAPGTAADATQRTGALTLLAWQLAMMGGRYELLPEIGGRACYRVSRATDLVSLPIDDAATGLLRRMQRDNLALDDIAAVPGVGFERACRLVNAVYLQGGLITLRYAPASRMPKARPAPASR